MPVLNRSAHIGDQFSQILNTNVCRGLASVGKVSHNTIGAQSCIVNVWRESKRSDNLIPLGSQRYGTSIRHSGQVGDLALPDGEIIQAELVQM